MSKFLNILKPGNIGKTYYATAPDRWHAVCQPDFRLDAKNDPETHTEHSQKDVTARGTENQD